MMSDVAVCVTFGIRIGIGIGGADDYNADGRRAAIPGSSALAGAPGACAFAARGAAEAFACF
jgi:hypothetical protein